MRKVGISMVIRYANNWIPTKTLSEMSNTEYDVLIVGLGPGGGAALQRLCQLGKIKELKRLRYWKRVINYFIPTLKISLLKM